VTESAFERVTAALDAKTGPGRNGQWRCPAHDDSNPSLTVTDGGGKVILHCHRDCTANDIVAALDLTMRDLFDQTETNGNSKTIAATYDYTDLAGVLLFQKVRYSPKSFSQRRPDGRGGWEWKLGDVAQPLYRLPELIAGKQADRTIFVVEGEKDADALIKAGKVATCNPGGAGKWRQEHTETLAGATEIIVWADKDLPGWRHARTVYHALRGRVTAIRVVEARGSGKDAADHLASGHGPEDYGDITAELEERCGDTSIEEPPPDEETGEDESLAGLLAPIDWQTFWAQDATPATWLVEPLIPAGRQVAIFSAAKAGKSLLTLEMAAAKATGKAVLDQEAGEAVHVVYVDMEMTEDDLRERLEDLGYGPDNDLSRLHYYQLQNLPPLDTPQGGKVLYDIVKHHQAQLVVLDTMARVVEGDENDADTYRDFYRHTGRAIKQTGASLVRLDHSGKDQTKGQRGSSGKADDVDVVFRMTVEQTSVILTCTHSRVPWVAQTVRLTRHEQPNLHHQAINDGWLAGTSDTAHTLDQLQVPLDATVRTAQTALKTASQGRRQAIIRDALRYRRQTGYTAGIHQSETF
jgi:5S rRNA maturation endonuclease (ribonuclease M5)